MLKILFLTFTNSDVSFLEQKLAWRSYTIAKALLITKWIKLIDKKNFVKVALNENFEIFVVYVIAQKALLL